MGKRFARREFLILLALLSGLGLASAYMRLLPRTETSPIPTPIAMATSTCAPTPSLTPKPTSILTRKPTISTPSLTSYRREFDDIADEEGLLYLEILRQTLITENLPTGNEVFTLSVFPDTQDLPLSCEASSAGMILEYFGVPLPEGYNNFEEYFIQTIPRHCNPHRGFRGAIDGAPGTSCEPPEGYGVYAEPIAEALNNFEVEASVEYGVDYKRVREAVRDGCPVMIWCSFEDNPLVVEETDPETGENYRMVFGEHTIVVIGIYPDGKFLINDPQKGRRYPLRKFPKWELFDGMRVVVRPRT